MIHYEEHVSKMPLVVNISYDDQQYCQNRKYYRGRSHVLYDPADSFFESIPLRAAESHTWVEITHCGGVHVHHHENTFFGRTSRRVPVFLCIRVGLRFFEITSTFHGSRYNTTKGWVSTQSSTQTPETTLAGRMPSK